MKDLRKTKQELLEENLTLKKRIKRLEHAKVKNKSVEAKLKESEERFKSFIENGPGIAWIKDEEGRHVYLSETYERRFGVKFDDCCGKTDFELWPFEVAKKFRKNDLIVLQDNRPIEVIEETEEPDGKITFWWNFKFLICDVSGRRYVGGFGLDITKQKKAELELANAMQRLHFHLENTPLAVIEFNKYYQITYWSKQAEKLFGWTAEEVMGKKIDQLKWVHEDDIQRVATLSADMIKSRHTSNIHTNRNYRKDGSVIVCQWYNSALVDEKGELISVHSQVLNITKRKLVEEEREKLISELQEAMSKIKTLSGLLPICSSCKKIRDDKGYWNQIEQYISEHSEAEFTHGICPECCKKLYPDIYKNK